MEEKLDKMIYTLNSCTTKVDKNLKQQGGRNLPTRVNSPARSSEVTSVTNYGDINSVNTANLYKDKNFSVQQFSKSNTIRQHSDLSLVSQHDRNVSFKRNTGPYFHETNIDQSPSYRTTTNHN